jgi:hypothetical protein
VEKAIPQRGYAALWKTSKPPKVAWLAVFGQKMDGEAYILMTFDLSHDRPRIFRDAMANSTKEATGTLYTALALTTSSGIARGGKQVEGPRTEQRDGSLIVVEGFSPVLTRKRLGFPEESARSMLFRHGLERLHHNHIAV